MYVFTKRAEDKLLKALEDTPHEKMAVFAASSLHNDQHKELRTRDNLQYLRHAAREYDVRIFMLEDGDVAFLFTDRFTHIWPKFEARFALALPGFHPDQVTLSSLMRVYELPQDIAAARELVYAKLRRPLAPPPALTVARAQKQLEKAAKEEWDNDIFMAIKAHRGTRIKPLICVADDDEFILSLVRSVLRPTYEVITTQDARTVLRMYNLHAPDILLLDIMMPHFDGMKVLQEIFCVDRDAIILMLSAHSTEKHILEAQQFGACGFLTKPFKPESLLLHIESMLAQRRRSA